MNKNNTQFPSLKELEQMLWRKLQDRLFKRHDSDS